MQTIYVGVDMAKASFEAAVRLADTCHSLGQLSNNPSGYRALAKRLQDYTKNGASIQLVLEATGTYHLGLLGFAYEQGWQVSLPNPTTVREWAKGQGIRAKHDKIDARTLANYGAKEAPGVQQPLPTEVLTLSLLLNRQADLEKTLRQELNRLESFRQRPEPCPFVLADLQASIAFLQQRLLLLQQAIKEHVQAHPHLKQQRTHLLQVPGIGAKSVLHILVFLYRWDARTCGQGDFAGLTAFAGLDPLEFSSGSSVFRRPAISKMGDAHIRRLLFLCALGGVHANDNPLVAFYQRLLARHKPKKLALVAAGRKILAWAFGVFRSGKPFDPVLASPKAF